jgi:chaperone modulatory protein CbpM
MSGPSKVELIGVAALCEMVVGLRESELNSWIALRWVQPEGPPEAPRFLPVDVARVRLIMELRQELAVTDEAIPLVLQLLDRLYQERARLRRVRDALQNSASPEQVASLLQALGNAAE